MNETRTTKAEVKIIETNRNLSAELEISGETTKKQALSDFGKRLLVLLNLTFQVAEDEPVQIAVHDVLNAAHFIACAVVLDHRIRTEDIRADLRSPFDVFLFAADGGQLGFLFLDHALIQF